MLAGSARGLNILQQQHRVRVSEGNACITRETWPVQSRGGRRVGGTDQSTWSSTSSCVVLAALPLLYGGNQDASIPQFSAVCGAGVVVVVLRTLYFCHTGGGGFSTRERDVSCGRTSYYRCGLLEGVRLRTDVKAEFFSLRGSGLDVI